MKALLRGLAVFFAVSVLIYLGFAFVSWNFNPGNWEPASRGLFVWFDFIFGGIITAVKYDNY